MDIGATHRPLKRIDVAALAERVLSVDERLWDAEAEMRRAITSRRPARSIFVYNTNVLYLPHDRRITQADIMQRAGWDWFAPTVLPIMEELMAFYPSGCVIVRSQIARLSAGGTIAPHQDVAPLLRASHRIHVPIITFPEVAFFIDEQQFHFDAGEAFELNNQKFHEVRHAGAHDRYHLIFDLLPPDYDPAPLAAAVQGAHPSMSPTH